MAHSNIITADNPAFAEVAQNHPRFFMGMQVMTGRANYAQDQGWLKPKNKELELSFKSNYNVLTGNTDYNFGLMLTRESEDGKTYKNHMNLLLDSSVMILSSDNLCFTEALNRSNNSMLNHYQSCEILDEERQLRFYSQPFSKTLPPEEVEANFATPLKAPEKFVTLQKDDHTVRANFNCKDNRGLAIFLDFASAAVLMSIGFPNCKDYKNIVTTANEIEPWKFAPQ